MKKNKVIGLIVIIFCIILVITILNFSKNKDSLYNKTIDKIINASINWTDKYNNLKKNSQITITLGVLKSEKMVNIDIKNPKTGKLFADDTTITIKYIKNCKDNHVSKCKNNYLFKVAAKDMDKLDSIDGYDIINLNSTQQQIDNKLYRDINNKVLSLKEIDVKITKDKKIVDFIDSSKLGTYVVYYNYKNSNKKFSKIFNVIDNKVPEIIFTDDKVNIDVDSYDLYSNVTCKDNSNNCSLKIIDGEQEFYNALSNKKTGKYQIKYEAKDAFKNSLIKVRNITLIK